MFCEDQREFIYFCLVFGIVLIIIGLCMDIAFWCSCFYTKAMDLDAYKTNITIAEESETQTKTQGCIISASTIQSQSLPPIHGNSSRNLTEPSAPPPYLTIEHGNPPTSTYPAITTSAGSAQVPPEAVPPPYVPSSSNLNYIPGHHNSLDISVSIHPEFTSYHI